MSSLKMPAFFKLFKIFFFQLRMLDIYLVHTTRTHAVMFSNAKNKNHRLLCLLKYSIVGIILIIKVVTVSFTGFLSFSFFPFLLFKFRSLVCMSSYIVHLQFWTQTSASFQCYQKHCIDNYIPVVSCLRTHTLVWRNYWGVPIYINTLIL